MTHDSTAHIMRCNPTPETPEPAPLTGFYADMQQAFPQAPTDEGHDFYPAKRAIGFVSEALLGNIESVTPPQAWVAAAALLRELQDYHSRPAANRFTAFGADNQEIRLGSWLTQALDEHEVDSGNLNEYLYAMSILGRNERDHSYAQASQNDEYVGPSRTAAEILGERHDRVKALLETPEQAAMYTALLTSPRFMTGFGRLFHADRRYWGNVECDPEEYTRYEELLDDTLRAIGITNPANCKKAWRFTGAGRDGLPRDMMSAGPNLVRMARIESLYPGGVKLLHESYGILDFTSQPLRVLGRQIEQHGKSGRPYGIFVGAAENSEGIGIPYGCLGSDANPPYLTGSIFDAVNDYDLRVVQAASDSELAERLAMLRALYGEITFVVTDRPDSKAMLESALHQNPGTQQQLGTLALQDEGHDTTGWFIDSPVGVHVDTAQLPKVAANTPSFLKGSRQEHQLEDQFRKITLALLANLQRLDSVRTIRDTTSESDRSTTQQA